MRRSDLWRLGKSALIIGIIIGLTVGAWSYVISNGLARGNISGRAAAA